MRGLFSVEVAACFLITCTNVCSYWIFGFKFSTNYRLLCDFFNVFRSMTFISVAVPGWVKNQDPGSGSGMNIWDHISKSLETIFWVLGFWVKIHLGWDADADPGSGNLFNPGRKKFGSGINIPNPQHSRLGRRKHAVQWTDWSNCKRRGGKVVEALQ
jgi:hypothetical protein